MTEAIHPACVKCRYDLTGIASDSCPECGEPCLELHSVEGPICPGCGEAASAESSQCQRCGYTIDPATMMGTIVSHHPRIGLLVLQWNERRIILHNWRGFVPRRFVWSASVRHAQVIIPLEQIDYLKAHQQVVLAPPFLRRLAYVASAQGRINFDSRLPQFERIVNLITMVVSQVPKSRVVKRRVYNWFTDSLKELVVVLLGLALLLGFVFFIRWCRAG